MKRIGILDDNDGGTQHIRQNNNIHQGRIKGGLRGVNTQDSTHSSYDPRANKTNQHTVGLKGLFTLILAI